MLRFNINMNTLNNITFCSSKLKFSKVSKKDLPLVSNLQAKVYNELLNEGWSNETAQNFINYSYNKQPDLFFVAKQNDKIKGYTFGYIKPWADGNHLMHEELVVDFESQKQNIGTKLYKMLLNAAIKKYKITQIEATTYYGENNMPMRWYEKLGLQKQDLFLINGNPNKIFEHLKALVK